MWYVRVAGATENMYFRGFKGENETNFTYDRKYAATFETKEDAIKVIDELFAREDAEMAMVGRFYPEEE